MDATSRRVVEAAAASVAVITGYHHYCPIERPAPRQRASIGAAWRPTMFGADLNFALPNPRTFPGLTAAGDTQAHRQDHVCSSHGIGCMDQLRADRAEPRGNAGVRALSCAEQFRAMAFAQLTRRESLRDIEVSLTANSTKLYAMGIRSAVMRSPDQQDDSAARTLESGHGEA